MNNKKTGTTKIINTWITEVVSHLSMPSRTVQTHKHIYLYIYIQIDTYLNTWITKCTTYIKKNMNNKNYKYMNNKMYYIYIYVLPRDLCLPEQSKHINTPSDVYIGVFLYTYLNMYSYIYAYTCISICIYTYIYTYFFVSPRALCFPEQSKHINIYIYTYIYRSIHIYKHMNDKMYYIYKHE
jgi:hypothetical protein